LVLFRIILLYLFRTLFICIGISCGSHTEVIGGIGHVEGYGDPVQNCTECHGNDLQGEDDAPHVLPVMIKTGSSPWQFYCKRYTQ
jgi:hypothetical protein